MDHGASWRQKEILDLLAFWSDAKVQQILKSSHTNNDCFEEIAEQVTARGRMRSATECRNKAKAMQLQYKRAMRHNNRSV